MAVPSVQLLRMIVGRFLGTHVVNGGVYKGERGEFGERIANRGLVSGQKWALINKITMRAATYTASCNARQ